MRSRDEVGQKVAPQLALVDERPSAPVLRAELDGRIEPVVERLESAVDDLHRCEHRSIAEPCERGRARWEDATVEVGVRAGELADREPGDTRALVERHPAAVELLSHGAGRVGLRMLVVEIVVGQWIAVLTLDNGLLYAEEIEREGAAGSEK